MAVEANMKAVLNAVAGALQQDGSDNKRAAYISYLQCIQQVTGLLLQDAISPDISVGASTKKCVQLGQQCMERILELVDSMQHVCQVGLQAVQRELNEPKRSSAEVPEGQASGFQLPELPSPTKSLQAYMRRAAEPSPMEVAHKKNQQLMFAYKKRMSNVSAKGPSATNINLSLQRRMAENVAIARGREEALAKKVQERQRRLEQEAALRFASTAGMSKEEQERRHIYSQVLIYEADAKYLQSWRDRLSANPEGSKLVQDLILLIINTKDHPLTQLLNKMQYAIYDKLRPLVLNYVQELNRITVPYIASPEREQVSAKLPNNDHLSLQTAEAASLEESQMGDNTSSDTEKTFADSYTQNQTDLESGLHQNNRLSQTLKADTKQLNDTLKNITYNDQFDDLFDDDDNSEDTGIRKDSTQADDSTDGSDIDLLKDLANVTKEDRIENLKMDALQKHLGYITTDVREGMDKLSAMFIIAYEALDSAAGSDLCWSSIEGPFFKPLWPYLLALYRLANYYKEVQAAKAMSRLSEVTPADMGVKKRFCPSASSSGTPFQSCITELTRLTQLTSPLLKLESVVRLCKLLCQIMEDNSAGSQAGQRQATGADDLLPVLSYVVIHSRLPQLVAECQAMEEFIHEGYLMGEEGYCLTSLQTSLNYVISMSDGNIPPVTPTE